MLSRTTHKMTTYELDIVRMALKKMAPKLTNEQDKMTAWMLYDRLNRESLAQRREQYESKTEK